MIRQFKPKKNLEGWVDYVWLVCDEHLSDVHKHDIVIPLCHMNVVFNFLDDYFVDYDKKLYKMPGVVRVGLLDHAVKIRYGESVFQIGIALKLSEMTNAVFAKKHQGAYEVIKEKVYDGTPSLYALYDELCKLEKSGVEREIKFEEMLQLIWGFLEQSMDKTLKANAKNDRIIQENRQIFHMIQYIEDHLENFRVIQMAQAFNISVSTLERIFKKEVGLSPKTFANIKRFLIQNKIQWSGEESLDYYYDQAHLIKDTRRFTNKTPKHLNVQQKEITLGYIFSHLNSLD